MTAATLRMDEEQTRFRTRWTVSASYFRRSLLEDAMNH